MSEQYPIAATIFIFLFATYFAHKDTKKITPRGHWLVTATYVFYYFLATQMALTFWLVSNLIK